jgi:uncharacterized protein YoxC
LVALGAALVAMMAAPAVASAATPMRGVVSGSPYGASNGFMAVPVLFSKETMRGARLRSPVGVIILKRMQQVKLPGGAGYTTPANLRTGDRFKGAGSVGKLEKRAFYPRVVFPKAVVYFRSKEMSLAELSVAVEALRSALADLQRQLNDLKAGTLAGLQSLQTQINDLRKTLESLQSLTQQVNNLASTVTSLQQTVNNLVTQVSTLTTRLGTICTGLKGATVLVGGLPVPITFPPNTISTACP